MGHSLPFDAALWSCAAGRWSVVECRVGVRRLLSVSVLAGSGGHGWAPNDEGARCWWRLLRRRKIQIAGARPRVAWIRWHPCAVVRGMRPSTAAICRHARVPFDLSAVGLELLVIPTYACQRALADIAEPRGL